MAGMSDHQVLIVDDDAAILASFERVFHRHFMITTCNDPIEALNVFKHRGPFSVIISDMHMPGLDGIAFLSRVRDIDPDTVRIMLTGDSDVQVAVNAVNEGNIFRFLMKPCDTQILGKAIVGAIKQYELITAEHELLEKTLKGSIQVLTEVLSMTNPIAFNKAKRLCHYAIQLAKTMHLPNAWQYEIAALLSQIGCLTLPSETVEKYFSGLELNDDEKAMVLAHPNVGYELLNNIPRMKSVALMIKLQYQTLPKEKYQKSAADLEPELLGGLMLKSCIEFEQLLTRNFALPVALKKMEESTASLVPELLDAIKQLQVMKYDTSECKFIKITELSDGMLLTDAISAKNGTLIVGKDCIINPAIRQRLLNFMKQGVIDNLAKVAIR